LANRGSLTQSRFPGNLTVPPVPGTPACGGRLRLDSCPVNSPGLRRRADGSLTIAIQASEPADPGLKANWLPVGPGPFYLILRSYEPDPRMATGEWPPPPVTTVP